MSVFSIHTGRVPGDKTVVFKGVDEKTLTIRLFRRELRFIWKSVPSSVGGAPIWLLQVSRTKFMGRKKLNAMYGLKCDR